VADFAANNAGFFPKNTAAPQIVAALTSAVTKLSDEASTRVTAEAEIRTSRRARITARETLRTTGRGSTVAALSPKRPAP
jgi:hypothetical protein